MLASGCATFPCTQPSPFNPARGGDERAIDLVAGIAPLGFLFAAMPALPLNARVSLLPQASVVVIQARLVDLLEVGGADGIEVGSLRAFEGHRGDRLALLSCSLPTSAGLLAGASPMLRAAGAKPGEPGAHIGQDSLPDDDADRLLGVGRGENLLHLTLITHCAFIERQLDPIVRGCLALGEGGREVRMMAAPAMERGDRDIEEIRDIGFAQAVGAELAGLFGIGWSIRNGVRVRLGRDAGMGPRWLGGSSRISLFLRRNREFFLFSERVAGEFVGILV